jgi:hypothetical protein
MPYVYLLQPAEFINTNCYKIGMSSLEDLSRLKSYGHGTKYIQSFECINYIGAEKELIDKLNQNVDVQLFKGREYFCGALKNIRKVFIEVMNKYLEMELETQTANEEYEETNNNIENKKCDEANGGAYIEKTAIANFNFADNKTITCKLCKYNARDKFNYERHLKSTSHQEKEKNASKCKHCSSIFYNKYSMLRHEKVCKQNI